MMSSLSEIHFNYKQAIEQANQLDSIAKNLKKAANRELEQILNDVNRAWKSDSTQAYIKKGRKLEGDMCISAKNLNQIADAIRSIAKRIRDAELEAWRIAHERT